MENRVKIESSLPNVIQIKFCIIKNITTVLAFLQNKSNS